MRKYILLGSSFTLFLFIGVFIWHSKPFTTYRALDIPRKVYIQPSKNGFQLMKDGKPFFIRGAAGNALLKELADAGGNTIRLYDTINLRKILLSADSLGLSVIVDIDIPRYNEKYDLYQKDKNNAILKKNVRNLINTYKDYSALLLWNLGNEVNYPMVIQKNKFIDTFNDLIDIIHNEDPNHPVSTSLTGASIKQPLSLFWHSPNLDMAAFNIFGDIRNLRSKLDKISIATARDMPFYISEWGANGPWEEDKTTWEAPIEPTSTKKGEQYKEIYAKYIVSKNNCIGGLVFYWGQKQERTQTWFNIFDDKNRKSQTFYELQSIWKNNSYNKDIAPQIKYMLLDERGSKDNIIFTPNAIKTAQLLFNTPLDTSFRYSWEIRPEAWYYKEWDHEKNPSKIDSSFLKKQGNEVTFKVPKREGPYRIYVHVHDQKNNFAIANTPFYVLKGPDEK